MFSFTPLPSHPVHFQTAHIPTVRALLISSLLDPSLVSADAPTHRVATKAANILFQRPTPSESRLRHSKRGERTSSLNAPSDPDPRPPVSSQVQGFNQLWKVGAELLRARAPLRARLNDEDENEVQGRGLEFAKWQQAANGVTDEGQEDEWDVEQRRETGEKKARDAVKFLVRMSGVEEKLSEELLLEITLYQMRFGLFEQAYERLQSYLPLYPYNENAALLGYAGVLCYLMWQHENARVWREAGTTDRGLTNDMGGEGEKAPTFEGDFASRHYSEAMQHFESAFQVAKDGDASDGNDFFLFCYLKLMIAAGDKTGALKKVKEYVTRYPNSLNGLRYLISLARQQGEHPSEWIPHARTFLQLDPVSDPAVALVPLVEALEATTNSGDANELQVSVNVVALLANRLDYDAGDEWMWAKLVEHLRVVRKAGEEPADDFLWQDRRSWWPSFHFSGSKGPTNEANKKDLVVNKAIFAQYIFPETFARLKWRSKFEPALSEASHEFLRSHGMAAEELLGHHVGLVPEESEFREEAIGEAGGGENLEARDMGTGVLELDAVTIQPAKALARDGQGVVGEEEVGEDMVIEDGEAQKKAGSGPNNADWGAWGHELSSSSSSSDEEDEDSLEMPDSASTPDGESGEVGEGGEGSPKGTPPIQSGTLHGSNAERDEIDSEDEPPIWTVSRKSPRNPAAKKLVDKPQSSLKRRRASDSDGGPPAESPAHSASGEGAASSTTIQTPPRTKKRRLNDDDEYQQEADGSTDDDYNDV
ncbi:hypothetical protein HK104_005550 [Borealophlyctis nickersoniae]|nr:hypothetical protein HK104_005550 [Borealophlyctis nickersoniae]